MAEERRFSHITVTPHAEEEVVIHVGPTEVRAQPAAQAGSAMPAASAAPEQHRTAAGRAPAPDALQAVDDVRERDTRDAYHETTLEDLERQPMPITQKIVIVAAAVLLIGFALYYLIVL